MKLSNLCGASSLIAATFVLMCSYDPGKYGKDVDDDRDMEAGYASIQMEERRRYVTYQIAFLPKSTGLLSLSLQTMFLPKPC